MSTFDQPYVTKHLWPATCNPANRAQSPMAHGLPQSKRLPATLADKLKCFVAAMLAGKLKCVSATVADRHLEAETKKDMISLIVYTAWWWINI